MMPPSWRRGAPVQRVPGGAYVLAAVVAVASAGCGDDGGSGASVGFRDDLALTYRPAGAAEDRTVPVAVWYPAEPGTGAPGPYEVAFIRTEVGEKRIDATPRADLGPLPVAIYTHGSGATGVLGYPYGERLAAAGWLVLAPDHVGNTIADASATFPENLVQRPQDLRAVLDWVRGEGLPPELAGLAGDDVLLFGHSWGTQGVLLLAGGDLDPEALRAASRARVPDDDPDREEALAAIDAYLSDPDVAAAIDAGFADDRVRAFAVQSPAFVDLLAEGSLEDAVAPVMVQAAIRDSILPYDENVVAAWQGLDDPDDVLVEIEDGGHYTFTTTCTVLGGRFMDFLESLAAWDTDGCNPDLLPQEDAVRFMADYLDAFARRAAGDAAAGELLRAPPPAPGIQVTFRD